MTAHADYTAIQAVNWSTLKFMAVSGRKLQWMKAHPRADSAALKLGRALHCAILEPERFVCDYVAAPCKWNLATNDGRRCRAEWLESLRPDVFTTRYAIAPAFGTSKVEKEAKADWESIHAELGKTVWDYRMEGEYLEQIGVEVLEPKELEDTQGMADALRAHPVAREYLADCIAEDTVTWTDEETGIACKARVDMRNPLQVLDLKTHRYEMRWQIVNEFRRRLYAGQLAFYHDGLVADHRLPPDARMPGILAVQNEGPYDVVAGPLSETALSDGRALYRALLKRYALCEASGIWPGVAPGPFEWDISPYDVPVDEEGEEF